MSTYDPTDIHSQERSKADADWRDRLDKEVEEADFKWLMGSKRGRRMVWRTLDRAGVFRLSFSTNAMATAFAEGCKNEGLRTLAQIHAVCPDLYSVMVKEQEHGRRHPDDASHKSN